MGLGRDRDSGDDAQRGGNLKPKMFGYYVYIISYEV